MSTVKIFWNAVLIPDCTGIKESVIYHVLMETNTKQICYEDVKKTSSYTFAYKVVQANIAGGQSAIQSIIRSEKKVIIFCQWAFS